jgi:AsmA protein
LRSGRKVLLWVGVPLALILLALVLVPVLFEDRIAARARLEIEKRVDARVDWADAGLGFFRNFPNVTLTLEDL